jgi:hypothetical protein
MGCVWHSQIALVGDEEGLGQRGGVAQQVVIGGLERLGAIEDCEHEIGIGNGLPGFFYSEAFRFASRIADAGGVEQADGNAIPIERFGDEVARGAGFGGDDGASVAEQAIEQAGFAHVGSADDGHEDAGMHGAAELKTGQESVNFSLQAVQGGDQVRGIDHSDIVVGEIDAGFEPCDDFGGAVMQGAERVGDRSGHLTSGGAGLKKCVGVDEVAYGFGLGEVEASIEKGAAGKFAGLGEACAAIEGRLEESGEEDGGAVGG